MIPDVARVFNGTERVYFYSQSGSISYNCRSSDIVLAILVLHTDAQAVTVSPTGDHESLYALSTYLATLARRSSILVHSRIPSYTH